MAAKLRYHDSLIIRSWVLKGRDPKKPQEIQDELVERIETIDEAIGPWREGLRELQQRAWPKPAPFPCPHCKKLLTLIPPRSPEMLDWAVRIGAWQQIAHHFSNKLWLGKAFPRIVIFGGPWDMELGRIHILDLPPDMLRNGVEGSRHAFEAVRAAVQTPDAPSPLGWDERLVELAQEIIRFDPVQAFTHPFFWGVARELVKTMHYAPARDERAKAVNYFCATVDAFVPDLSQHRARSEKDLLRLLANYEACKASVVRLLDELQAKGPKREVLIWARRELELPVKKNHLLRWHRQPHVLSAPKLARAFIAQRERLSPGTVANLLVQARRIRPIQEAWEEFRAFCQAQTPAHPALRALFPPDVEA